MKLFNRHIYILISRTPITKEQRRALADGTAHVHGNPIRKPLIRFIRDAERNATKAVWPK